jgi:hypothetical protein
MPRLEAGRRRGVRIPYDAPRVPFITIDTEAGRIDPRASEKVIDAYSPSILRPVTQPVSCTSTSSGSDHHVLVVGGAGQYRLGLFPRNGCRNAWETVVL